MKNQKKQVYAFIDAANLFYGGEKNLGWKIDYQKLLFYLKQKYGVQTALYFGGIEIHDFPFDYQKQKSVPVKALIKYFTGHKMQRIEILHSLKTAKFYARLQLFGYLLYLKPVKTYYQQGGVIKKKANCDVDMTFHLMRLQQEFDGVVILSGDGDFLPVLQYLQNQEKEVVILARSKRTARELKQFAQGNFSDFTRLRKQLEFYDK
ncbi:MAG: hypothetical protein A2458_02250 [Candidatus Kerfeldbacteria bacterium RIFOXYC2_FULL_38_9]|uniref:NYN domain-containing protein n=1 Tax=Candidatus Kerfeldbacteria bacterium RIFOXYB2_FULL_38_14 TaxID=1798547 RepID=A0A1G2BD40_9BACT|nr:MAG: hypothetical protein A2319_01965 [Candidatus Kerfeldbacteria bacterium RIFOXYB2_FULL_38_14]OGY90299.1 MAG: hypothetical protein A2458_02250 [Candidatus Kerfeldbacteria bacterium RIFOXYC2_FULL_38_9]